MDDNLIEQTLDAIGGAPLETFFWVLALAAAAFLAVSGYLIFPR